MSHQAQGTSGVGSMPVFAQGVAAGPNSIALAGIMQAIANFSAQTTVDYKIEQTLSQAANELSNSANNAGFKGADQGFWRDMSRAIEQGVNFIAQGVSYGVKQFGSSKALTDASAELRSQKANLNKRFEGLFDQTKLPPQVVAGTGGAAGVTPLTSQQTDLLNQWKRGDFGDLKSPFPTADEQQVMRFVNNANDEADEIKTAFNKKNEALSQEDNTKWQEITRSDSSISSITQAATAASGSVMGGVGAGFGAHSQKSEVVKNSDNQAASNTAQQMQQLVKAVDSMTNAEQQLAQSLSSIYRG